MNRIRSGSHSLGTSESLVKSYRRSKEQFNEFETLCEYRGLIISRKHQRKYFSVYKQRFIR